MDADDIPFCHGRVIAFGDKPIKRRWWDREADRKKPKYPENSLMHKLSKPLRNKIVIPNIEYEKVEITQEEALALLLIDSINYERAMFMCDSEQERGKVHDRYTRFAQRPYSKDEDL